jgi:hypothetical protein
MPPNRDQGFHGMHVRVLLAAYLGPKWLRVRIGRRGRPRNAKSSEVTFSLRLLASTARTDPNMCVIAFSFQRSVVIGTPLSISQKVSGLMRANMARQSGSRKAMKSHWWHGGGVFRDQTYQNDPHQLQTSICVPRVRPEPFHFFTMGFTPRRRAHIHEY